MELDESYYIYKLMKLKGVGPVLVNKMLLGLSSMDEHISGTLLEDSAIDELKNWLDDEQIKQLKTFDPQLHDQIRRLKKTECSFCVQARRQISPNVVTCT